MPELTPLADWNREHTDAYFTPADATPNGLACPLCGAELEDTSPGIHTMSLPPQTAVNCSACEFKGTRVA